MPTELFRKSSFQGFILIILFFFFPSEDILQTKLHKEAGLIWVPGVVVLSKDMHAYHKMPVAAVFCQIQIKLQQS